MKRCERHARRCCAECGEDGSAWWWLLEALGQLVLAVLEGLADADWGDD